jgi:hypothetical protein
MLGEFGVEKGWQIHVTVSLALRIQVVDSVVIARSESDEAIQVECATNSGLLRVARNDGRIL